MRRYFILFALLVSVLHAGAYDFEANGLLFHITSRLKRTVEVTHWDLMTGPNGVPTHPRPDLCLAHQHDSTHVHGPHCHHTEDEYRPVIPQFPDTVVVPQKVWYRGVRYTVTAIGDGSFFARENIQVVRLPKTIKRIGRSAFSRCLQLQAIDFPASVETIDEHAFYMNNSIEELVLPEGLKHLEVYAFALCYYLRKVQMPQGLRSFQANAFVHCTNLKHIILRQETPPEVSTIGIQMHFNNVHFEVPQEALPAYERNDFWRKQNISPLCEESAKE